MTVGGEAVGYAFAPGAGGDIKHRIVAVIGSATRRLRVASMVTSSEKILAALKAQLDAQREFAGFYDRGETDNVIATWTRTGQTDKVELSKAVTSAMIEKPSLPYSPQNAHNFMHDKLGTAQLHGKR